MICPVPPSLPLQLPRPSPAYRDLTNPEDHRRPLPPFRAWGRDPAKQHAQGRHWWTWVTDSVCKGLEAPRGALGCRTRSHTSPGTPGLVCMEQGTSLGESHEPSN